MWLRAWGLEEESVLASWDSFYETLEERVKSFDTFMRSRTYRDGFDREPVEADIYYLAGLGIVDEQVMDCTIALLDAGDRVAVVLAYFDGYDDKGDKHLEIAEPILKGVQVLP
jgi:hypothetical protein